MRDAERLRRPDADPGALDPTPNQTAYQLGTDVWYEGLILHMDLATAVLDPRGGTVDIAFRIENPGTEASSSTPG